MPARIQRQRTRGWRMPPGAIYVGRPTRWGNPFKVSDGSCGHPDCGPGAHPPLPIDKVLDAYRSWVRGILAKDPGFLEPLRDRDLACWCRLGSPCHADVLLEMLYSE